MDPTDADARFKLTRVEKLFLERLGELPRDYISREYELATYVVKIQGVWKQLPF
jgi:hypothetical protein